MLILNYMFYFPKGDSKPVRALRGTSKKKQKNRNYEGNALHSNYIIIINVTTAKASRNQPHNHLKSKSATKKEGLTSEQFIK